VSQSRGIQGQHLVGENRRATIVQVFWPCVDFEQEFGNHNTRATEHSSLSSVQILRILNDLQIETRRSLIAVVWACEEASFESRLA